MADAELPRDRGKRAGQTLLAGVALVALALGLTLTRHPLVVSKANGALASSGVTILSSPTVICQPRENLPAGTSAVRLSLVTIVGGRVSVRALRQERVLTSGSTGPGWTSSSVTIPVTRVTRSAANVTLCVTIGSSLRGTAVYGSPEEGAYAATSEGSRLPWRMRVEYLRPGQRSWWSSILPIARRMGLGHALAGSWVVLLLVTLEVFSVAVAYLILSGRLAGGWRGIPKVALACALVACANAVCWSFLTPPFEVTDEPDHYAYVQQLLATGSLPSSGEQNNYSSQEAQALADLHAKKVRHHPETHPIASRAEQAQLERDLAQPLSQTDNEGATGVSASEPPFYYALAAIPYSLSGNVLDRIELMRLLGALLAAVTALFVVLFLREALPGAQALWAVGGLGVAFAPLLGYVSGAVNPETMLVAVSSALFYCLARGFRRGLTRALTLAIGALLATGLLTKLNFIGLAPGAILGLTLLTVRETRRNGKRALRLPALTLALAAAPVAAYTLIHEPALNLISGTAQSTRGSIFDEISYIWQFYLPRLPGMRDRFPGILPSRDIWFDRSIGIYGWLDTVFPRWAYDVALVPAGVIVVLCASALAAARLQVRARIFELLVYATMVAGLLVLVGGDSYAQSTNLLGELYAEPRYLLPMSALMGGALAVAARGAGRRWVPVVGALIVSLILAHDLFSQLQAIARYYG